MDECTSMIILMGVHVDLTMIVSKASNHKPQNIADVGNTSQLVE